MPIVNRPLTDLNNVDEHYEGLVKRQAKNNKNHYTSRNYASFPSGSTVVGQCKDGGPWTHGTVFGRGNHNHNRSYMICTTKTGHIVTRNSKHIKAIAIIAEQYLQDQ